MSLTINITQKFDNIPKINLVKNVWFIQYIYQNQIKSSFEQNFDEGLFGMPQAF